MPIRIKTVKTTSPIGDEGVLEAFVPKGSESYG